MDGRLIGIRVKTQKLDEGVHRRPPAIPRVHIHDQPPLPLHKVEWDSKPSQANLSTIEQDQFKYWT